MLKEKRNIKPKIAKDYNEVVRFVKNEEVVIYIIGDAYHEMFKLIKETVANRRWKKFGIVDMLISLTSLTNPLGWVLLLTGGFAALSHCKDDLKKYKINIDDKKERIELYLSRGDKKYDLSLDTIV